jgi:hypothetical protein
LVADLAGRAGRTSGRAVVALAATLAPLRNGATAAAAGGRGRGGSSSRSRGRAGLAGGSGRRSGGGGRVAGAGASALGDLELGLASTLPRLDGEDLEVVGAEGHAVALPGVEVVLEGDGAAGAGSLTDADGDVRY